MQDWLFRAQGALASWRATHGSPAVAMAIRVDGRLVASHAAEPGGGSVMPTYSLLKTFTAAAALRLQERGALALDSPVTWLLPEAPIDARATVRDLLRHTSGLPCYGPLPAYHEAVRATPSSPWREAQFLDVARTRPALFAPGTGWAYSNLGYLLVRRLLEQATGLPFARVIDEEIVRPLGLRHTRVVHEVADWAACVPGLGGEVTADPTPVDIRAVYHPGWCAPGVAISTPEDVTHVFDAVVAGPLLSPASRTQMLATVPVPGEHPPVVAPTYGLGLQSDAGSPLGRNYGHGGGGPGYALAATVYPDAPCGRLAIAVGVATSAGPRADDCERTIMQAVLRAR